MTCQNCVRHVTEALGALPGVRSAEVDLASGSASLEAERQISREELAAALDEAGYELA
jgi:copper chaperone CopZ